MKKIRFANSLNIWLSPPCQVKPKKRLESADYADFDFPSVKSVRSVEEIFKISLRFMQASAKNWPLSSSSLSLLLNSFVLVMPWIQTRFTWYQRRSFGHWLVGCCLSFIALAFAEPRPLAAQFVEATQDTPAAVVIHELLVDPADKSQLIEFVELHNRTAAAIDLTGWSLGDGVDYFFPAGTSLPPHGYLVVAQNGAALQTHFGVTALGPFSGRLNNSGESLTLRDADGKVINEISYGLGFPWPITGGVPQTSLQLINPNLDNSHPAAWRSGPPTPGAPNSTWTENPPPAVDAITHTPAAPTSAQPVVVTARVADADGVAAVVLQYQRVAPGDYIRLGQERYHTEWTALPMALVAPDTYRVELPPATRQNRHLIRYRVVATDSGGRSVTLPYADDPQPNFAYYVYDGVPTWQGAIQPNGPGESRNAVTYDFNAMRPLPVYQLLAHLSDIEDAQFIPWSRRASGYMGDDYLWTGTLIYNGQVYDHIGFRSRGGLHRYAVGKNQWKFNFHRGHRFQAYDDAGRPYPELWDKLNFSAVIQHATRGYRGEHGLFETLSYRLFNLAGVPAPRTHYIHFRIVDEATEQNRDQYTGDFWGLYLAFEEVDGHFLDARGLPDGNLYKMENNTGELNNHGPGAPPDKSDLNAFLHHYTDGQPDPVWWRANLDLPGYYSYRAIIEAVHHYDINQGKNYHYFQNPETGLWSVIPWDVDLTWAETMAGDGNEPFRDRVLKWPEFQRDYQNRLREIRDLLFNPEQIFPMIDESAAVINTPADGPAMVDADRAQWDWHPFLGADGYTDDDRSKPGNFYQRAPNRDFAGMVQLMKAYVVRRSQWIDENLLTEQALPATPTLTYSGPPGYPADQLSVQSSPFQDNHAGFAAMQWRTAQILWPGLPGHTADTPNRYEIEATWQSAELPTYEATGYIPAGACEPGLRCRVRVRMKNTLGHWSHWSEPLEFVAAPPARPPINTLAISEIMYHPLHYQRAPESDFEFLELHNQGTTPLYLSNVRLTSGIAFTFPVGSTLPPNGYLVLAKNAARFSERYGFAPFGEFAQRLDNGGETLLLLDPFDRTILSVTYSDDAPWPTQADGLGYSLVLKDAAHRLDPNRADSWRASTNQGGSPGFADPLPILINELLAHPSAGQPAAIELHNPTPHDLALTNWSLVDGAGRAHRLPNKILPAGDYWTTPLAANVGLPMFGGMITVQAPTRGNLPAYEHRFRYAVAPPGESFGRYVNAANQERFPLQSTVTLGKANAAPAVGPVVISEILPNAAGGLEFIELTNVTSTTVPLYDPQQPALTWRITGVLFQFPSGVTIPPHGKLVITAFEPSTVCTDYRVDEAVRVLGPLPLPLDDRSEQLRLERPLPSGDEAPIRYVAVDEVGYSPRVPWPLLGEPGVSLERLKLTGYGDEPLSWQRGSRTNDVIRPASQAPTVDLCSFDVYFDEQEQLNVRWVTRNEIAVQGFQLWRSPDDQRANATLVTAMPISAAGTPISGAAYEWHDETASAQRHTYWLEATGPDGTRADVAFTSVRLLPDVHYLPFIFR